MKRTWQGIPGIERSPGGRLFATWFTGGTHEPQPENTVVLTYSDECGRSFVPVEAMAGPRDGARAFDPTLWLDPLNRLWLIFNRGNPESGLHGVYARRCEAPDADVPVWGDEFRLGFDEAPLSFRMNKPIVLASGEWVLPVTHAAEPTHAWFAGPKQRQGVGISTDQGASWTLHGSLEAPEWALENMIVDLRDGRLWMLIRTGSGFLWESFSTDQGRTWAPARQSALANPGSRFFIRRLASGNLLLVNHYRYHTEAARWHGRNNLTAQVSVDEGRTWNDGLLLDARDAISYPDGFEAPDGVIRIVYDRDRIGDGDILMATFTEADVLAGQNVSGEVRLRLPVDTLGPVRIGADTVPARSILGLGVEVEPPPFLFRDPAALTADAVEAILSVAERRLALLRPAMARLFCFPEQWNPTLDGETFNWNDPLFLRQLRILRCLKTIGCRVNVVLFPYFDKPTDVQEKAVRAMVAMIGYLRAAHGFDHLDWLTLFNEPESAFRHDSPLVREIFGAGGPHTWEAYVALNRLAKRLLEEAGLHDIRLALPDSAWGGQMRRERVTLALEAFPDADSCMSYHHYNPEALAFYERAPAAFQYRGMREEAQRFRRQVGPDRQLVIWEFNNAGEGFSAHDPGLDDQGHNVLETPEAGAKLAYRILNALRYGVDGLCLWHMHDSDVNKFGLWRCQADGFVVKPYWHVYALLCHTFRPGQHVLPMTAPPPPFSILATRDADHVLRVAVLNDSDQSAPLALDVALGGPVALARIDPTVIPPPEDDSPFAVTEKLEIEAGRLTLDLQPWELVIISGTLRTKKGA